MKMSSDTCKAISVILFYMALLCFLIGTAARLKTDFHSRLEISTAGFAVAAVLAALGRLDAEYRAVLVMRDIEGFDYQQMADMLSLPLGTLKSRLFRARLALRDELRTYLSDRK